MERDVGQPRTRRPETADDVLRRGEALVRTPSRDVDLRWHVQAFLVGDFAALALDRARALDGPG